MKTRGIGYVGGYTLPERNFLLNIDRGFRVREYICRQSWVEAGRVGNETAFWRRRLGRNRDLQCCQRIYRAHRHLRSLFLFELFASLRMSYRDIAVVVAPYIFRGSWAGSFS
jgi:hypothetical protein